MEQDISAVWLSKKTLSDLPEVLRSSLCIEIESRDESILRNSRYQLLIELPKR